MSIRLMVFGFGTVPERQAIGEYLDHVRKYRGQGVYAPVREKAYSTASWHLSVFDIDDEEDDGNVYGLYLVTPQEWEYEGIKKMMVCMSKAAEETFVGTLHEVIHFQSNTLCTFKGADLVLFYKEFDAGLGQFIDNIRTRMEGRSEPIQHPSASAPDPADG